MSKVFNSILFRSLIGITVVIVSVVGGYSLYNLQSTIKELEQQNELLHKVIFDGAKGTLSLSLWNMHEDSFIQSSNDMFKFGEGESLFLLDHNLKPIVEVNKTKAKFDVKLRQAPDNYMEQFDYKALSDTENRVKYSKESVSIASKLNYNDDGNVQTVGYLVFQYSLKKMNAYVDAKEQEITLYTLILTAIALILCFAFVAYYIVRPIIKLSAASKLVAQGEFVTVKAKRGKDEISLLMQNFNHMITVMAAHTRQLDTLVIQGREIAKQTDLNSLVKTTQESFDKVTKNPVVVDCHFSSKCFSDDALKSGFYHMDKITTELGEAFSIDELKSKYKTAFIVSDPKNDEILAVVGLPGDSIVTEEESGALQAMTNNLASAINTVRLEHTFNSLEMRTAQIQTIFSSIKQGICVVNEDNRLASDYSDYMRELFGADTVENKNLLDDLLPNFVADGETINITRAALGSILGENSFWFETNAHNLPKELEIKKSGQTKYWELDWTPMINQSDIIENVMLTIRDVTEVRRLAIEADKNKRQVTMLSQLLAVSPGVFAKFCDRSAEILEHSRHFILSDSIWSTEEIDAVKRDLHTLKGNSRTYKLMELTSIVHDTEQAFIAYVEGTNEALVVTKKDIVALLDDVHKTMESYEQISTKMLGSSRERDLKRQEHLLAAKNVAQALLEDTNNNEKLHAEAVEVYENLLLMENDGLHQILDQIEQSLLSLAEELGKKPPILHRMTQGNWILSSKAQKNLFDALVHMIRNTVDHGFDDQNTGKIWVGTSINNDYLVIDYCSNEEGLYIQKLREKAEKLNWTYDNDEMLAQLIFQSGMSTKDTVSEISGRGIGMDAVKDLFENMQGGLEVEFTGETKACGRRPFRFILRIPISHLVYSIPERHSHAEVKVA